MLIGHTLSIPKGKLHSRNKLQSMQERASGNTGNLQPADGRGSCCLVNIQVGNSISLCFTTTVPPRHCPTRPVSCRDAAHLEAGVPVLRKRGYRLHNQAGVDGLAQRIKRFLRQSDALTARDMRSREGVGVQQRREEIRSEQKHGQTDVCTFTTHSQSFPSAI